MTNNNHNEVLSEPKQNIPSQNTLVSICCLTFNHEKYIRECLNGFIMQETNFDFEVLIHDDASTDGTANIIREYEANFPDIIKPIYQVENQYSKGISVSMTFNFPRARGKYFAMCEGDDYWTDPLKLQKQVALMEKNADCSLCFHDVEMVFENIKKSPEKFSSLFKSIYERKILSHEDIIKFGWCISTPSMLFQCGALTDLELLSMVYSGDYALHLILTKSGNACYLPDLMAVARKHDGGISQTKDEKLKIRRSFAQQKIFSKYVDSKYKKEFYKNIISLGFHMGLGLSTKISLGFRLVCLKDFLIYSVKYLIC